ncbi:hypothetical protein [Marinitoga litoralis]|uniref:hypothetical protein n=1 Tax=Marinitoga litoralis TaxID=570855 RepID=UPI001961582F|nr:hypothetical protein [Marinitoga litoralis]MBM7558484.1 hypothetical protein [Marinitoga litoralis]
MEKRKILLLSIISLICGIVSLFLFLFRLYSISIIFFILYFIFTYTLLFSETKKLGSTFFKSTVSLILFPFYPIIHYYSIKEFHPLYKEFDFEEGKLLETKRISYYSFDLAPFNIMLKYGDPSQRKFVVRLVFNSTKNEKIDFLEGIEIIRNAIYIDVNPDVVLYASEALTSLENLLVKKISYYSKNSDSLEDCVNYAKYSYYYIKSGFLVINKEDLFIKETLKNIEESLKKHYYSSKLLVYYLKILEYTNNYDLINNLLENALENNATPEIYEYAILFYIKNRKPKKVQSLISRFLDYGFSPSEESIKFILGG